MRRNFLPRAQELDRLRAKGWRIVTFKTCSLVVAFANLDGKIHVKAWTRKADKTDWYYCLGAMEKAEKYVRDYEQQVIAREAGRKARNEERQAKRAALKASDHWAIGDVIYNSWGYDQTNVDWYQVIEVLPRSIRIREVAGNTNMNGQAMSGTTQPRRGEFIGKPMLKPLDEAGHVSFQFGCGTKWDGRPKGCSCYA